MIEIVWTYEFMDPACITCITGLKSLSDYPKIFFCPFCYYLFHFPFFTPLLYYPDEFQEQLDWHCHYSFLVSVLIPLSTHWLPSNQLISISLFGLGKTNSTCLLSLFCDG